jgi:small-conductance mechanosensitive channel
MTSGSTTSGGEHQDKWSAAERKRSKRYEGPVAPVIASLLIVIAWCVFILFYALYWSTGFNVYQNLIVTVVSLIITGIVIGIMWVIMSPRGYWRGGN